MTNLLFSTERQSAPATKTNADEDSRLEYEKDHDRILFSAPIRRLADKTQVFPLETNDSVRTRLTHSHEVSNLCRSLTLQIIRKDPLAFTPDSKITSEAVSVIAAAAGLAHDVGNPPFGHQGEEAIRTWFNNKNLLFKGSSTADTIKNPLWELSPAQQQDLTKWEGNAQALRLVTRLQVAKGNRGLNLTYATLAALMKYTVSSDKRAKDQHPAQSKFGYFQADRDTAQSILDGVGLKAGQRHVLAYVMEACDDIAYSVIDVEDAISKGLVSLNDVLAELSRNEDKHSIFVTKKVKETIKELRESGRSLHDIRDISLEYFRSHAIAQMIVAARTCYIGNKTEIIAGTFRHNLVKGSTAGPMCKSLKNFAMINAFQSAQVTELELEGSNLIHQLMDYYWKGIKEWSLDFLEGTPDHELAKKVSCPLIPSQKTLFSKFVYNQISRNYRSIFEAAVIVSTSTEEIRYNQLLLLADMISGMTEDFVTETHKKLRKLDNARE